MENSKLTKSAENLLSYFRTLPKGEPITASRKELAKALNIGTASVSRAIKQLEEQDYVRIESGGATDNKTNTYFLTPKKPTEIIHITAKKPESSFYLLDKVTQKTFEITKSGHYSIGVENKKDKEAGREINVFLEIDFSKIENNPAFKISNPLTPYDKRIHNIICSLWKVGDQRITLAQIYRELEGKAGLPSKTQAEKIRESAEKMAKIVIDVDNQEEAVSYRYSHFHSGRINLLPSESITDRSIALNGQILDYCLYLYREPPLLTYAEAHQQITAFTPEQAILPDGLSTTEDNLMLDDYLKYRIARHKAYGTKILYKTIYEMCKIDNKLKRSRATIKIRKLFIHYRQTGMIKSYQEKQDGIIFAPLAVFK